MNIEQLFAELAVLQTAFEDACRATAQARSAEITALNRVNNAQKKVDEWVSAAKAKAHSDTDWGRSRAPGRPA